MRLFWLAGGWTSLGLGVVGMALPLLPTTPFLLLAAFCFARGSERVHAWLIEHPTLGPPIQDWRAHGVIAPRAKRLALVAIACTYGVSVIVGAPLWVLLVQALVLSLVLAFILSRPSRPRRDLET